MGKDEYVMEETDHPPLHLAPSQDEKQAPTLDHIYRFQWH